jgi:hypothetical protein
MKSNESRIPVVCQFTVIVTHASSGVPLSLRKLTGRQLAGRQLTCRQLTGRHA